MSIKTLSLYYHELMGKIKEHEGKKYLTVNDYVLDKFDDTKILIDIDDQLPDYITLKNVVILKMMPNFIHICRLSGR